MVTREPGRQWREPRRRAWPRPSDVESGTGIAEQLQLMSQLVSGQITGPQFARAWLAARRRELAEGERVRERFGRVLADVFYLLENYAIDPALRDPEDLTDDELVQGVEEAVQKLAALEHGPVT